MNCDTFYASVGMSRFADRYYALCARFPTRDIPACNLTNDDVAKSLKDLGQNLAFDIRDNSYDLRLSAPGRIIHIGFVIQGNATVEFWFWIDQDGNRLGSNFTVIANESSKIGGKTLPEPPFPRPEFHSVSELRTILAECFELADLLFSIAY